MGIFDSFRKKPAKTEEAAPKLEKLSSDCSYNREVGLMKWKKQEINPGDLIRIKHEYTGGYKRKKFDEAGIFLGIVDDDIVIQIGVKQERASVSNVTLIEVLATMDECED